MKPALRRNLPSLAALLAGSVLFLAIAADELYHGLLFQSNAPIRVFLHAHAAPLGVFLFSSLCGLGEFKIILPYALAVGAFLLYHRRRRATAIWATALLGSAVLNETLKHLFKIPRPMRYTFYVFPPHAGYSFPSGHTMGAAITAGATVLLASHLGLLSKTTTRLALLAAAALAILVAFSLMYMGVHTLTEALAGLAVSLAWLGAIALILNRFPLQPFLPMTPPRLSHPPNAKKTGAS